MVVSILQQFIIMVLGALAVFILAYQKGYNKCFEQYLENKENDLEMMEELSKLRKEKEEQMK